MQSYKWARPQWFTRGKKKMLFMILIEKKKKLIFLKLNTATINYF